MFYGRDDKSIAPSQLYAYAALMEGVPFANGAPNLTVDCDAMVEGAKVAEADVGAMLVSEEDGAR